MLEAYFDVFQHAGYTVAELREATTYLAQGNAPKFRTGHLPALQARLRSERLKRHHAENAALDQAGFTCSDCGGSGWVVVPHLRFILDGEWIDSSTMAVTCRCARGERIAGTYRMPLTEKSADNRHRPVAMRLVDYELRNPNWFQQQRSHEQQLAAASMAQRLAGIAQSERPLTQGIGLIPRSFEKQLRRIEP
jgi:hypothetical protein